MNGNRDPDCLRDVGCERTNIVLDEGIWNLDIYLIDNCTDPADCANNPADFKVTIGDEARVLVDRTGTNAVTELHQTVSVRIGPAQTDHAERGRQTLTINAHGVWILTFEFARGP